MRFFFSPFPVPLGHKYAWTDEMWNGFWSRERQCVMKSASLGLSPFPTIFPTGAASVPVSQQALKWIYSQTDSPFPKRQVFCLCRLIVLLLSLTSCVRLGVRAFTLICVKINSVHSKDFFFFFKENRSEQKLEKPHFTKQQGDGGRKGGKKTWHLQFSCSIMNKVQW